MSDQKSPDDKTVWQQWRIAAVFFLVLVLLYIWGQYFAKPGEPRYEISYSSFIEQLDQGNVKSVTIKKLLLTGELVKATSVTPSGADKPVQVRQFQTYLPSFQGEDLLATLKEKNVSVNVLAPESESALWTVVAAILPWALIIGVWFYIMRRSQRIQGGPGGLFSFGESRAKLYDTKKIKVTFADVAGMENVKGELLQVVDFLKDPGKYGALGAKNPRGVLLAGPPGTGKTLLARATAGEAGVPFYSISASEFIEMFVGVGAARVRDMFEKAKKTSPSIIFIDELDAVGRTRGTGFGGGHDEREQTLNQLLSELDGFETNVAVVVMAATNRPDVLDPALLRPGRFDRIIVVDRPGYKERKAILEIHTRKKRLAEDVDLDLLARGTPGMTGADLENLANEAALVAARKNRDKITKDDFEEARDVILMGHVREETISDMEKKITAYHEAGHALVARELPGTDPVHKVSIIPRGMAMGVTQQLPSEDRHYYPKSYLKNKLAVMLGGRAAEQIAFDEVSTGAQSDLKEATSLAEKMVAQWGMSEKVGPVNLGRGEEHPFLGRELALPKRYSEAMAWLMDQEIRRIVNEASALALELLKANRDLLDALADALFKEEVLEGAAIDRIIDETKKKRSK